MHKPESIQDNETHEILWDFEIHTVGLNPIRRLDQVLINKKIIFKKIGRLIDFGVSTDHKRKIKESKKLDRYLNLTSELKKKVEHKGDGDINSNWCAWDGPKRLEELEIRGRTWPSTL